MAQKVTTGVGSKTTKPGREDRLKAALKANMARRKAQARARTGADEPSARTGADDTSAQAGAIDTQDQAGQPADVKAKGRADG